MVLTRCVWGGYVCFGVWYGGARLGVRGIPEGINTPYRLICLYRRTRLYSVIETVHDSHLMKGTARVCFTPFHSRKRREERGEKEEGPTAKETDIFLKWEGSSSSIDAAATTGKRWA